MTQAANALLIGLAILLLVNGARLTFFPSNTCHLIREAQIEPLSHSVMEFHREFSKRSSEKEKADAQEQ